MKKKNKHHKWRHAKIYWVSESDGGRKTIPTGDYYYPTTQIAEFGAWSLVILIDESTANQARVSDCKVRFLFEHAPHHLLGSHSKLDIYEGPRKVARMVTL